MSDILTPFFAELLNSAAEQFNSVLVWMLDTMLHAETLLSGVVGSISVSGVDNVYTFIYRFAYALMILKFLFRGFQIYILWRDGDADSSPQDMLIGAVEAVAVMTLFPVLYDAMAEATSWFAAGIMDSFGLSTSGGLSFSFGNLEAAGLVLVLILLIYLILTLVLCVKLIQRGFELLVLRLGVPIACLGLIDSDMGLFKGYMQTIYKTLFTSVIQITLLSLSLRVVSAPSLLNAVYAIAIISTAFATPVIMQQLLVPPGHGGGVTNKIYTASMAMNAIKGLAGK